MTEHAPSRIERRCDVAIVGGSAAGLAAALQLSRQRRSVIVVDSGEPRNAPAAHMHGYLGHEGLPPADLAAIGRAEVRSYGGEVLSGRATEVVRTDDGHLRVELAGGHAVVARRVLAATGLVDELPDIDGVADHWGRAVIHCPFCHGYEVRDRRVVQIITHPMGLHPAPLFHQLTPQLTVVLHGAVDADPAEVRRLTEAGVPVLDERVRRVVTGPDGRATGVELADGTTLDADAIVVGPRFRARIEPFEALGLTAAPHPSGLGDAVETSQTGETTVPGLYAAGNVADPSHQVLHAAADGSRIGAMIAFSLASEDLADPAPVSGNQADWDHRYAGDPIWSGNPNGTLVNQAASLTPGRALDVGAGEGGDAVWLAEHGWEVTATDVSQRALDRIHAEATARGLAIECRQADANALDAFEAGSFDLVSAQYASVPRTPDLRAITNLLDAVAPGGTLLVVGHDLELMRSIIASGTHAQAFDPDAYVTVDAFVEVVAASPDWDIEVHGRTTRPPGAVEASSHHVDDIVLRARRVPPTLDQQR